jgi:hypothetical protein
MQGRGTCRLDGHESGPTIERVMVLLVELVWRAPLERVRRDARAVVARAGTTTQIAQG